MNQPPKKPGLTEAIKAAVAQAQQKPPGPPQTNPDEFQLAKPDSQDIGEYVIKWAWTGPFFVVHAYYCRQTPNVQDKNPGDYWVEWDFADGFSGELNKEEVKLFAQVLLSAYRWADNWQQFMGEFFMAPLVTPGAPPPPAPAQLHVVDEFAEPTMAPRKKVAPRKAVKKVAPKPAPKDNDESK